VKTHKFAINSSATKAGEKNKHSFGILRILEFLMYVLLNKKPIKIYWIKLTPYFYWQTSYLLDERASLVEQLKIYSLFKGSNPGGASTRWKFSEKVFEH